LEFEITGRSAAWLARLPWGRRVTLRGITSNSLSRRREGEAAGPAVQIGSPKGKWDYVSIFHIFRKKLVMVIGNLLVIGPLTVGA